MEVIMNRIQFYPDEALNKKLDDDAAKRGVATSALVSDILRRYYGLVPENTLSESDLTEKVFDEVKDYIDNKAKDVPFDLLTASPTYATVEMSYAGKPSTLRAKIGKAFFKKIGTGDFACVKPKMKSNGKILQSINNANMYVVTE
jgi:hypothetical protein